MSLDPVRIYDYLARSRATLLDAGRRLEPAQYEREFPIGSGTLARTFTHMLLSEWYYVQRLTRVEVAAYEEWPFQDERPLPFEELEKSWSAQSRTTRAAIEAVADWKEPFEYRLTDDEGRRMIVTTCAADMCTQLAFHEIHHRAQALNMLRHLGVGIEDLDFNALMFPRREASD